MTHPYPILASFASHASLPYPLQYQILNKSLSHQCYVFAKSLPSLHQILTKPDPYGINQIPRKPSSNFSLIRTKSHHIQGKPLGDAFRSLLKLCQSCTRSLPNPYHSMSNPSRSPPNSFPSLFQIRTRCSSPNPFRTCAKCVSKPNIARELHNSYVILSRW